MDPGPFDSDGRFSSGFLPGSSGDETSRLSLSLSAVVESRVVVRPPRRSHGSSRVVYTKPLGPLGAPPRVSAFLS